MPVYTFPYGASAFGVPQIAASYSIPISTGNYFWVSSVIGSNSNSGITPQQPFATIKYALSRCVANNYDCVIMMPGHAETISSAAYVTPVAGTTLCGIGTGSLRPTLTWSLTTSTIVCSAANLTFQNFLCNNSVTEVVTLFSCSAADITFNGVDYNEGGGAYSVVSFVTGSSACNRLAVQNCFHTTTTITTTAGAGWINLVGGDGIKIWDNVFMVNRVISSATAGAIVCLTTPLTNISILRNTIGSMTSSSVVVGISLVACSTGLVAYNTVANLGKTALAGTIAIANCMGAQNFSVHTVTKNGLLDPVVDS
jgi:hypothetical protein